MEHRRAAHRDLVAAVDAAAGEHLHRRLVLFHRADLHVRGVRAQQELVDIEEERVLRVARGMIGREVERLEVVPVGLDLGAGIDRVAHLAEDLSISRRTMVTGWRWPRRGVRAGRVTSMMSRDCFRADSSAAMRSSFFLQLRFDAVAQFVERVANVLLLFLRNFLEPREQGGDEAALAAEVVDAQLIERGRGAGVSESGLEVVADAFDFVEHVEASSIKRERGPRFDRGAG